MAELVLKNVKLLLDGYDLSGDSNNVSVEGNADVLDVTAFNSSGRRRRAGLYDYTVSMGGFWNATTGTVNGTTIGGPDAVGMNRVGKSTAVVAILPQGTGLGGRAYFAKAIASEYGISGSVGDMLGFTLAIGGNGKLIGGHVAEYGNISTNLTPTACDVGTASTLSHKLHASLHLISAQTTGKMQISIRGSSASNFGTQTTMLKWTRATVDKTTAVGSAKVASTKIPSTKLRYYKIAVNTSAGSTAWVVNAAVLVGVSRKQ